MYVVGRDVEHVRGLGILESHVPSGCLPLYPFLPGEEFPPPAPQPLALGPSPVSLPYSDLPSTAIPSPPCVRTGPLTSGKTWSGVHASCSSLSAWQVPSRQVGRATAHSVEAQRASPHLPRFMHCVGLMCRPQSQGVVYLSVSSWQAQREGPDAWLSFLTPNSAWTIVSSGWGGGLAVGGQ